MIIVIIIKYGNNLEVRKQKICIYNIMRNGKVMTIIKFIYRSVWQDKLQASTGERKHINTWEVRKQKRRWIEIHIEYNN
jgi:hypothetical protein